MRLFFSAVILFMLSACNKVETHSSLSSATKKRIQSLGLLDKDETILRFYSNYEEDKAGNFYTTKRIAHYWLDENDVSKNDTSWAFYEDIAAIDTNFTTLDTYAPYLLVRKQDGSEFKVFIEGKRQDKLDFYEGALNAWKKTKQK